MVQKIKFRSNKDMLAKKKKRESEIKVYTLHKILVALSA